MTGHRAQDGSAFANVAGGAIVFGVDSGVQIIGVAESLTREAMDRIITVPLDGDGFLRRERPTCEGEFKWLPSEGETEGSTPDTAGYYCPYCGVQAKEGWLTKAQVELARATVIQEVVDPMLDDFAHKLQSSSSGIFKVTASHEPSPQPPKLSEPDDMRRVDFPCHPAEPIKVLEGWKDPVHCLICGTTAGGDSADNLPGAS
jgi:hypothetical protein